MSKDIYNLSELSNKIAQAHVQKTDAMTAKYLEQVIKHITDRGDKIEDYTLAFVSNPMEFKKDKARVTMQYRVCRVDELQHLPVYGESLTTPTKGDEQMPEPKQKIMLDNTSNAVVY